MGGTIGAFVSTCIETICFPGTIASPRILGSSVSLEPEIDNQRVDCKLSAQRHAYSRCTKLKL